MLAALTRGRPSSTARRRAWAKCWYGPGVRPNQASLVTFRIRSGPGSVGQDRRREKSPRSRSSQPTGGRPGIARVVRFALGSNPPGNMHELPQADSADQGIEEARHILAEGHQMHLVVGTEDRAAIVDRPGSHCRTCPTASPGSGSSMRAAPVTRTEPGPRRAAIWASEAGIAVEQERERPIPARRYGSAPPSPPFQPGLALSAR